MKTMTRVQVIGVGIIIILTLCQTTMSMAADLGMVADQATKLVTVFDPKTGAILGVVTLPVDPGATVGDCSFSADGKKAFVGDFRQRLWVIDTSTVPPTLAQPPNPISIANFGEDTAITPDGRFIVTCDGSVIQPISVVDIETQTQVGTFDLGEACNSVDVCEDGSVLLTTTSRLVRRLMIDGLGTLTDIGNFANLSDLERNNVYCAPGARTGIVINRSGKRVQSFAIPSLSLINERSFSFNTIGISAVFNSAGDRVYVRSSTVSGDRSGTFFVDAFSFDPNSGIFGSAPLFSIPIAFAIPFFGIDQIALSDVNGFLFVPQPSALNVYDAQTGNLLSVIQNPSIVAPTGVCLTKVIDTDSDGLSDEEEVLHGTDPNNPDTDGDGLLDGFEVKNGFDPLSPGEQNEDPDQDGLDNLAEQAARTDPRDPDTDDDGLTDGEEVNVVGTNPLVADTDGDGALDSGDNCPLTSNAGQEDLVHPNGIGDACEDPDADGVVDLADNCPDTVNPDQADEIHQNGIGDACDDPDGDEVFDDTDNCPDLSNISQADEDQDGVGNSCDICASIYNPSQAETVVCISVTEDGGQCQETAIDLLETVSEGEIIVRGSEDLVSLTFELLATSCSTPDPITLTLNSSTVGTLQADPNESCSCVPGIEVFSITDPVLLAAWNSDGANTIRVSKDLTSTGIAWVRVRVEFPTLTQALCLFDLNDGDCTELNLCVAGSSFDVLSEEASTSDPFSLGEPVASASFTAGELPELVDIAALSSGSSQLCVSALNTSTPILYGSDRDGRLFQIDFSTGAGSSVGQLPTGSTEIEHDNITGRSFVQERDGAFFGHEFDISDGSGIGGIIQNGGSFTGLEYVGKTLYGTEIFGPRGPSLLSILEPFSGASTVVGATGLGPISGLAFDEPSGIMYGIEGGPGPADLVTIDLTKGKATVVGTTGIQAGSLQFGPDGSLFAGTTGFGGGKLYRIDPTSGAATLVGSTGFNRVTGLTLVDPLPPTDCVNFEHQSEVNLAINGAPCGPPIADAGADSQTECTSPAGGLVLLDGSGSVDFNSTPGTNDDIVLFEWFENFGSASQTLLETGEQVEVTLPLGPHEITLRVTDSFGDSSVDTLVVEVIDTTPPEIMLTLTPSELWPPNHRLVKVSASAVGSDNCGDPSILLTTVISSEPDDAPGGGDGATVEDIQDAMLGTADLEFRLRAERSGIGAGRIYSIVYTASDQSGNSVGVTGRVTVPHSRGGVVDPVELSVRESTSGTVVEWTDAVGALYYNVVRGEVSQVVDTGPQIDLGSVHCIESRSLNLDTTGSEDSEMPPPGNAFFYLVEYSDGALSSYGSASVNKPRVVISGACQ